MLVIARKRHEAMTIDGSIRVEVLRLTGGVARLRVVAPRHIAIMRGVAKPGDPGAVEAVNGGVDASGMGVVDLTLGNHQIVTIRGDIHLGMVDIDSTRALLFVDGPSDLAVKSEAVSRIRSHPRPPDAGDEAVQAFLPFSTNPDDDTPATSRDVPDDDAHADLEIHTIPFPGPRRVEPRNERRGETGTPGFSLKNGADS